MSREKSVLALAGGVACWVSVLQGAPSSPEQLRCEGLKNPQGIDRSQPRLSWAIQQGVRSLAKVTRKGHLNTGMHGNYVCTSGMP